LAWAIKTLAIAADDHVLEIGCGGGLAAWLVCQRLVRGRIVAIDRSVAMAKKAEQRNIDSVEAGRAAFVATALDAADFDDERFDKAFAINVNLFWVRSAVKELDTVLRALKPDGTMYLFYERPQSARAWESADRSALFLAGQGLDTTLLSTTTPAVDSTRARTVVCVRAARP
jgi:ubiquinone/menaquinone biosynthesis C-methylase UbiE